MKKDVYLSPRDAGGEMTEDIVSRLRKETAMAFEDEYGIWPPEAALMEKAAREIETLRKYKDMVHFISCDYHELSHDKIRWQRDDWQRRCEKLIESLESETDSDSVPGHPHIGGNND